MASDRNNMLHVDQHLVTFSEPRSFEAEQYQRLRQQIERLSATRQLRVIAVTSAVVGDGKTFTALNLAGALVQRKDRKVLLIDADLRRPSVMARLGLDSPDEGLATALQSTNGSFQHYVRPIEGTTLSVLPGEIATTSTYELITSSKFADLMKEARAKYDYIVVDTPPVLPMPDSGLMRDLVDGYLLVVSARSTPRKLVAEALNQLEPASVIGLVYNRDDRPLFGFYRSHYRQYFRAYVKSVSEGPFALKVTVR
jgi:protein-tyrosine kinase